MKDSTVISSDPVVINVNMVSSTRRGLELLRRVRAFADEMETAGLVVELEGFLTVRVHAPELEPAPATTAKPARPVGPEG